jgi:acyl-coenzyme A thioesterase PaaI-like protein
MDIIEIPFIKKLGITRTRDGQFTLAMRPDLQNHLQTLHASAQFALAEAASGEILQTLYPQLVGKVVPVLRASHIKFKKPASQDVFSCAAVSDEALAKFDQQFANKGRALITVDVELKDTDGVVTCSGSYDWFVQGIEA